MRALKSKNVTIDNIKKNIREYESRCPDGILFIDTETTGLSYKDKIIQLSVIAPDRTVIIDTLIKPNRKIHPRAAAVHGFRNSDLVNYPTFAQLQNIIIPFLSKYQLWGYNMSFDFRMIIQSCTSAYLAKNSPNFDIDNFGCLMRWFALVYREWSDYFGSYKWQKLTTACRYYKINLLRAHNARYDALACVELYEKLNECEQNTKWAAFDWEIG